MEQILSIYDQFLGFFPRSIHGAVSFVLAILIIYAIYKVIKHNFIWLILLIILLPASKPILLSIWDGAVHTVKFLLTR